MPAAGRRTEPERSKSSDMVVPQRIKKRFRCSGGSSEMCVESQYKRTYEEIGTIKEKLSLEEKR